MHHTYITRKATPCNAVFHVALHALVTFVISVRYVIYVRERKTFKNISITRMFYFILYSQITKTIILICVNEGSLYTRAQERVAIAIERGKARSIVVHADLGGGI